MDLKKVFIPVFMSLVLISLATPFLTSAATLPGPTPYPGPKGPSWCYIPINSVGSGSSENFQGYSFSLSNSYQQQNVSSVYMNVKIPSAVEPYYVYTDFYGYLFRVLSQNEYAIWVALSPYTNGNSGSYFTQAGLSIIENTSGNYLELFTVFTNGSKYVPFYQEIFPLSDFSGKVMVVKMQYTGNSINVVFSTNSFYQQVKVTQYLFTPHSGLIIGEIPQHVVAANGTKFHTLSYPLPNDTFSVNFGIQGGIATNAEVYSFEYTTGYNILSSVAVATCYYNNQNYTYISMFQWLNNYNSYSAQGIENATSVTTYINGTITLGYEESPASVGLLKQS